MFVVVCLLGAVGLFSTGVRGRPSRESNS
jgi:hypothetical protein